MRTFVRILKVVLALAVVNAAARAGYATWKNIELKESAQRLVLFGREQPEESLRASVLARAAELELPVTAEQVSVRRQDLKTVIDVAYDTPVEVFPTRVYRMKFNFSVEGFNAMR
jgi:hypothetical protein